MAWSSQWDIPKIMKRWGNHYTAIKRIGSYPLNKELQLSDLGKTPDDTKTIKAEVQRCYIDMKKDGINIKELSVIDYLCLLSMFYLLAMTLENHKEGQTFTKYVIENFEQHKAEAKNLLRFATKHPEMMEHLNAKEILLFWHDNYMKDVESKT